MGPPSLFPELVERAAIVKLHWRYLQIYAGWFGYKIDFNHISFTFELIKTIGMVEDDVKVIE